MPVPCSLFRVVEGEYVRCLTQGSCVCCGGEAVCIFGIAHRLKGARNLSGETAQPTSGSNVGAAFSTLTPSPSLHASRSVKDKGQKNGIMAVSRIWL